MALLSFWNPNASVQQMRHMSSKPYQKISSSEQDQELAYLEMLVLRQDISLCKLNVRARQEGIATIRKCNGDTLRHSGTLLQSPV